MSAHILTTYKLGGGGGWERKFLSKYHIWGHKSNKDIHDGHYMYRLKIKSVSLSGLKEILEQS